MCRDGAGSGRGLYSDQGVISTWRDGTARRKVDATTRWRPQEVGGQGGLVREKPGGLAGIKLRFLENLVNNLNFEIKG